MSSGTREVHAKVDRTVFHFEGDIAIINARFKNECSKAARPMVKLIQQQTFYGRGLVSKTFKKSTRAWLLAPAADLSALKRGQERVWTNVECTLPAVVPSFHSAVIDVDYYMEIELVDASVSFTSKAAAKMLMMSHSSSRHTIVASVWVLLAEVGAFQKKPSTEQQQLIKSLKATDSAASFASNTSDSECELHRPLIGGGGGGHNTSVDSDDAVLSSSFSPEHSQPGSTAMSRKSAKELPAIREESKE